MRGYTGSRRAFLERIAAATAAGMLGRRGVAQQPGGQTGSATPPKKARITSSVMIWTLKGTTEEKFARAARAGMQSVELVSEHVHWTDAEVKKFKDLAQSYNLGMDTIVAQTDWVHRPVSMVNPAHREAFLHDIRDSAARAKKLGVPQIIVLSGNEQPGMSHEAQYASLVESAKQATHIAEEHDVTLILENLNSKVNHKGYFLTSAKEALQCVKDVDNPHFRFLFDIYHEYVQNGDPIPVINDAWPYVAVFHVADAPGRHDPGTGEMKWADIYKAIGKTGYSGYVTMEYMPVGDEVDSLTKAVTEMRKDINAATPHEPSPQAS